MAKTKIQEMQAVLDAHAKLASIESDISVADLKLKDLQTKRENAIRDINKLNYTLDYATAYTDGLRDGSVAAATALVV